MGKLDGIDDAGRQIAGLLGYNPGPGIYSRLERAIEAMPENVRAQELPGLLKRYKEGVPGWELKATDLDEVIAGRDVVPRGELLARVKERSPVYTHQELLLQKTDQPYATGASALGRASAPYAAGDYEMYGQGGKDYSELLVLQPGAASSGFDSPHFSGALSQDAVAHARYDTHGDALRINELQSDLGIHNRRARERPASDVPEDWLVEDHHIDPNKPSSEELPFPLEDAWSDLLIKRLALEAARKGHRAIEVASPRAIADKVGGNIDNYEHFYGKVVPGALERLGRKMGGLADATPTRMEGAREIGGRLMEENARALRDMDEAIGYETGPGDYGVGLPIVADIGRGMSALDEMSYRPAPGTGAPGSRMRFAADLPANIEELARMVGPENMNEWMLRAREAVAAQRRAEQATFRAAAIEDKMRQPAPPRRYIMSDEMRRRLIEGGVGASLLAPLLMQDGE
jgi:hypothetical protein